MYFFTQFTVWFLIHSSYHGAARRPHNMSEDIECRCVDYEALFSTRQSTDLTWVYINMVYNVYKTRTNNINSFQNTKHVANRKAARITSRAWLSTHDAQTSGFGAYFTHAWWMSTCVGGGSHITTSDYEKY